MVVCEYCDSEKTYLMEGVKLATQWGRRESYELEPHVCGGCGRITLVER